MEAISFPSSTGRLVHAPLRHSRHLRASILQKRIATVLITLALAWMAVGAFLPTAPPSSTLSVQVQPGDTLWVIADRYGDPDEYILRRIARLEEMNGLESGGTLRAGQTLIVPTRLQPLTEQMIASR